MTGQVSTVTANHSDSARPLTYRRDHGPAAAGEKQSGHHRAYAKGKGEGLAMQANLSLIVFE